jgi:hypothetical protein
MTTPANPLVTMLSPDGQIGSIPTDQVNAAVGKGFKLGQDLLSPDGKSTGTVPLDAVHDALKAGFKLSPSSITEASAWNYAAQQANAQTANLPMQQSSLGRDPNYTDPRGAAYAKEGEIIQQGLNAAAQGEITPQGIGVGAMKGVAETAHTVGRVVNAATGDRISALPTGFKEPASTEALNHSEIIGKVGENVLEFFLGDEALKEMSVGQKIAEYAKLTKLAETYPKIAATMNAIGRSARGGAVVGGQTLLHGGTPEEAAKNAAVATTLGVGTEAVLAGATAGAKSLFGVLNKGREADEAAVAARNAEIASDAAKYHAQQGEAARQSDIGDIVQSKTDGLRGQELVGALQNDLDSVHKQLTTNYGNALDQMAAHADIAGIRVGGPGSALQSKAQEILDAGSGLPDALQKTMQGITPGIEPAQELLQQLAKGEPMSWAEASQAVKAFGKKAYAITDYANPLKRVYGDLKVATMDSLTQAAEDAKQPGLAKNLRDLRSDYHDTITNLEKNSVISAIRNKDLDGVAKILMSRNTLGDNVTTLRGLLDRIGSTHMQDVESEMFRQLADKATDATGEVDFEKLAGNYLKIPDEVRGQIWGGSDLGNQFKTALQTAKEEQAAVGAAKDVATAANRVSAGADKAKAAADSFFPGLAKFAPTGVMLGKAGWDFANGNPDKALKDIGLAVAISGTTAALKQPIVQKAILSTLEMLSHARDTEPGGAASASPKLSARPTGFSAGIPVAGVGDAGGEAAAQNVAKTGLAAETRVKASAQIPPERKLGDAINNAVAAKGEGFTFHPQTGEVPTEGFMVEVHPEARQTLDHPPTANDIHAFLDKNKDLLASHPELHVGGYGNELNISGRYQTEADAVAAGKKLDQISIYDLKNGAEIPTGGQNSGKVSNYPIAERHADLTGAPKPGVNPDRISTRVPTAKKATEDALTGEPLIINRAAVDAAPGLAQKMADKVRGYDGVKVPANIKDPAKVLSKFQDHVADNLRWIWNQVPKETQEANARWYESANQIAKDISEQHGMEPRQGAGVIASMSPQKDWDMNVSLAHRIADIHHLQGATLMTPEMEAKGVQLGMKSDDLKELLGDIKDKTYDQLTDPVEKAAWARIFDETYSPRDFSKIDPGTGEPIGLRTNKDGSPSKVAWGSLNEGAKAVSIMQDGSRENISKQLGGAHKVRNFYNNIIDPSNTQDVTIDTHAVAAAHMQPFSGNSAEVAENFSGSGSNATGVSGTYPLYADAYRQVAKEMGIKPRELQSVVWEWARNKFQNFKTEKGLAFAKEQWALSKAGKITADQARESIANEAQKAIDNAPVAKGKVGKISAVDFLGRMKDDKGAGAEVNNTSFPGGGE